MFNKILQAFFFETLTLFFREERLPGNDGNGIEQCLSIQPEGSVLSDGGRGKTVNNAIAPLFDQMAVL